MKKVMSISFDPNIDPKNLEEIIARAKELGAIVDESTKDIKGDDMMEGEESMDMEEGMEPEMEVDMSDELAPLMKALKIDANRAEDIMEAASKISELSNLSPQELADRLKSDASAKMDVMKLIAIKEDEGMDE